MEKLEARQASLASMNSKPERVKWVATGQTVGQMWQSLSPVGRNPFLREWGIRAFTTHDAYQGPVKIAWADAASHVYGVDEDGTAKPVFAPFIVVTGTGLKVTVYVGKLWTAVRELDAQDQIRATAS